MRMGVMFNSRATFQQRRKSNVRFLPLFRSIFRSLSLSLELYRVDKCVRIQKIQ